MNETAAIIVAAGRGTRAGDGEFPKQYRRIGGVPILRLTLDTFLAHPRAMKVLVIVAPGDETLFELHCPTRGPAAGACVWRRDAAGVRA